MLGMAEPKRLYQKIGRNIRQQIVDGEYPVGSRLPAERDIAEQLAVSRTIVREALIMLELEGLIEVRKGSGIHVIANEQAIAANEQITDNDVGPFELLQARQLLESHIAAFAATQVNKSNLQKMKAALELEQRELKQGGDAGDHQFHIAVAEATQNSVFVLLVEQLWEIRRNSAMWKRLHQWIEKVDYLENWIDDHQKIIDALASKKTDAARQAMWQHLENVKTTLLKLSDKTEDSFDRYLFDSSPAV